MSENPLLARDFEVPFHLIEPSHVTAAVRYALEQGEAVLARLASVQPAEATYANTIGALDEISELIEAPYRIVLHLTSVKNSPELRAAFNEVQPEVVAFVARLGTDQGVWSALKAFARTEEAAALQGVWRRHLELTLEEFRRSGADLKEDGRRRVAELKVELASLSTRFSEHVLDDTNAYELVLPDGSRLQGLPESALRLAAANAAAAGKSGYMFTLHAPSFRTVALFADDRDLRRELHEAFFTVGASPEHDNVPLIHRILQLRQELAELLGYDDYSDYQTSLRMVKSGAEASRFLRELTEKTAPHFTTEAAELTEFAAEELGIDVVEPWDVAYAFEKMRKARFSLDEEELRPYFPLEGVLAGLFQIAERLFGVRVEKQQGVPVWHESVDVYHLTHEDGTFLGAMYADWFPRSDKRGGAWMNGLRTGGPTESSFEPHIGVVAANFTPPEDDRPSLLTHAEVQTAFHEFGHLVHFLLSRVPVKGRSSMNVPWDFVELPSQIMENWTWEREGLDLFARHYETGEPLPDQLYARLKRSRTFGSAHMQMRQLSFGTVDLALHRDYDGEQDGDPVTYASALMAPFVIGRDGAAGQRLTRFTHVFAGGYACGYYSYKWSEVLDADAFSRFQAEGIFNPATGREFAEKVLWRGDSEDPTILFRDFMGRDPDVNALILRNLGSERESAHAPVRGSAPAA